jgi:nitrite reductase/ring-hydroxylating ferredoxin subunit
MSKNVEKFVNALLRGKRPQRFDANADEAAQIHAATALRSANATAPLPRPEFIENLAAQMARAQNGGHSRWDRRTFLLVGGSAAAGVVAAVAVDHNLGAAQPNVAAELVPDGAKWTAVARVSDVPAGGGKAFTVGAVQGFLVNQSGTIAAVSAICTHMGCVLALRAQGLVCPCHDATFNFSGDSVGSYKTPKLPAIRTRVTGDNVEVFL